jgi:hypothetical protein
VAVEAIESGIVQGLPAEGPERVSACLNIATALLIAATHALNEEAPGKAEYIPLVQRTGHALASATAAAEECTRLIERGGD